MYGCLHKRPPSFLSLSPLTKRRRLLLAPVSPTFVPAFPLSLSPPPSQLNRFYKVRAHLLEKAIKDREGGVEDTPITDLESDVFASPADGGAAAAAPAAKPRRRTAGSVEETLGV